jgi:predicted nucleic acid-binding protein
MACMIDSCVYLDVFTKDARWSAWSAEAIAEATSKQKVILNAPIFAELSVRFPSIAELEDILPAEAFHYHDVPREAAFLAGKCFARYRKRGGTKTSPLPDFFIGAHAAISGYTLITRDPRRFREYFPKLKIVCP